MDKVDEYPGFSIYQVSKMINGKKVPLYKESFRDGDIRKLEKNGYRINDDSCGHIGLGECNEVKGLIIL